MGFLCFLVSEEGVCVFERKIRRVFLVFEKRSLVSRPEKECFVFEWQGVFVFSKREKRCLCFGKKKSECVLWMKMVFEHVCVCGLEWRSLCAL